MPSALRGNRSFSGSPFSVLYAAAEQSLVVVANTPQQTEALRALGLDLLWEDQRVQDWRNHPDVSELLGDRMQQAFMERTADAWEDLLAPAAPRGASRLCRQ
jgi:crotonobetainyl-CoA:carnitine CoA-transferase CaiB-like acyl-CoA transferase